MQSQHRRRGLWLFLLIVSFHMNAQSRNNQQSAHSATSREVSSMNRSETAAYKRLRKVPAKLRNAASFEAIKRVSEEQFKKEHEDMVRRQTQTTPVYEALREILKSSPQFEPFRAAYSPWPRKRPELPTPPTKLSKQVVKSPILHLGSFDVVDVPPFLTATSFAEIGPNTIFTQADPSGTLSIAIGAGNGPQGQEGSGIAGCWAGVGQDVSPPTAGAMQFSATPSFSWSAGWGSSWWRQAAGLLWIGQFISRFDQNGNFVDTPVSTQITLYSFNDTNLFDNGMQTGSSSGFSLQSQVVVDPNFFYRCFVWIGASANADTSNAQSYASVGTNASLGSLTLQMC